MKLCRLFWTDIYHVYVDFCFWNFLVFFINCYMTSPQLDNLRVYSQCLTFSSNAKYTYEKPSFSTRFVLEALKSVRHKIQEHLWGVPQRRWRKRARFFTSISTGQEILLLNVATFFSWETRRKRYYKSLLHFALLADCWDSSSEPPHSERFITDSYCLP